MVTQICRQAGVGVRRCRQVPAGKDGDAVWTGDGLATDVVAFHPRRNPIPTKNWTLTESCLTCGGDDVRKRSCTFPCRSGHSRMQPLGRYQQNVGRYGRGFFHTHAVGSHS